MASPKDWPVEELELPGPKWPGVLNEPICLCDDLGAAFEERFKALEAELGVKFPVPQSPITSRFCFNHFPGFWPVGWGPDGPLPTKERPPGRPRKHPKNIPARVRKVQQEKGLETLAACYRELANQADFKNMTADEIKLAHHRDRNRPEISFLKKLRQILELEDKYLNDSRAMLRIREKNEKNLWLLEPAYETRNWNEWKEIVSFHMPEQKRIFEKYSVFEHRPILLSVSMRMS